MKMGQEMGGKLEKYQGDAKQMKKTKKVLTNRELQIGRLLVQGYSYVEISTLLYPPITENTVRCLASRMYVRLGVNNRYHATDKLIKMFKKEGGE